MMVYTFEHTVGDQWSWFGSKDSNERYLGNIKKAGIYKIMEALTADKWRIHTYNSNTIIINKESK